jgi:site-specific DNA recombinase
MTRKPNQVRSAGVYLFSGIVSCTCGEKMYMRKLSPKYICKQCKNKIEPDILEEVFQEQLKNFLFSDVEIQKKINADKQSIEDKKLLLSALQTEVQKIKEKIDKVFELYYDNKLPKQGFEAQHNPLYSQQQQKLTEIAELQSTIDSLSVNSLSSDQVLHDAKNLHKQWGNFSQEEKKNIIETVVKNIIVGKDDIEIELAYLPMLVPQTTQGKGGKSLVTDGVTQNRHDFDQRNIHSFGIDENKAHNYMGSSQQPA